MAAITSNLRPVCDDMISGRVSKRKDGLRQLVLLLKNETTRHFLDENSLPVPSVTQSSLVERFYDEDPQIEEISWDFIVLRVVQMVDLEISHAEKRAEKGTGSSRSLPPFRTDTIHALKDVFSAATKDNPSRPKIWWSIPRVIRHVVNTLCSDFTFSFFWSDYGRFLLERLLSYSPYLYVFRNIDIGDLLSRYLELVSNPKADFPGNLRLSSEILFAITKSYPLPSRNCRVNEHLSDILKRFVLALLHFEIDIESVAVFPVLRSINDLLLRLSVNNSSLCRDVTLELQDVLLRRYRASRAERVKDEIVLFFRVQMRVFKSSVGELLPIASDGDPLTERAQLRKLYQKIMERYWESPDHQLQSAHHGARASSLHNSLSFHPRSFSLLDLGADVLFRLSKFSHSDFPSTPEEPKPSLSPPQQEQRRFSSEKGGRKRLSDFVLSPGKFKKRKETKDDDDVWGSLLDQLDSFSSNTEAPSEVDIYKMTHLMHLIVFTLRKHPQILRHSLRLSFLEILGEVLQTRTERTELEIWCMCCLTELAQSTQSPKNGGYRSDDSENEFLLWKRVWFLVCRRLSQRSRVAEVALRLMTAMMERDLIDSQDLSQDEIWRNSLFDSQSSSSFDTFERSTYCAAVKFIFTFLSHFELQTTLAVGLNIHDSDLNRATTSLSEDSSVPVTCRERLLRWLLRAFRISSSFKLKISTLEKHDETGGHQTRLFSDLSRLEEASWVSGAILGCIRAGPPRLFPVPPPTKNLDEAFSTEFSYPLSGASYPDVNLHYNFNDRSVPEWEEVERDLSFLSSIRSLSLDQGKLDENLPMKHSSKDGSVNHISLMMRRHLVETTGTLLSNQIKGLLAESEEVTSDRLRTVGINVSKLTNKLIEIAHHCHLITILILELSKSQGFHFLVLSLLSILKGVVDFFVLHLHKSKNDKQKFSLFLKELVNFAILWKSCPHSLSLGVSPLLNSVASLLLSNRGSSSGKAEKVNELDFEFETIECEKVEQNQDESILLSCIQVIAIGCESFREAKTFKLFEIFDSFTCDSSFGSLSLPLQLQWYFCYLRIVGSYRAVEQVMSVIFELVSSKGHHDFVALYVPSMSCTILRLLSLAGKTLHSLSESKKKKKSDSEAVEVCESILNLFITEYKEHRLNWAQRLCLSECFQIYIDTNPSYPTTGEPCASLEMWENFFLLLLKDQDYRVRHFMSKEVTILFSLYEKPEALYMEVESRLGVYEKTEAKDSQMSDVESNGAESENFLLQSEEELKTILLTLGNIAQFGDLNEERILLLFVLIASKDDQTRQLAVSILDIVAACDGFLSRGELLQNSFSQILSLWIGGTAQHQQRSIFDFPFKILGRSTRTLKPIFFEENKEPTIEEFLQNYLDQVLPQLLYVQDEESLVEISSRLSTPLPQLLKTNFSFVFAHIFPLKYCSPHVFNDVWAMVNRHLTEEEKNFELSKQLDEILVRLVSLLVHPTEGPVKQRAPNGYDQNAISRSILHLQKLFSQKSPGGLLISQKSRNKDRFQQIILYLNERLYLNPRPSSQLAALQTVTFFMNLTKEFLPYCWAFRDLVHLFLRGIQRNTSEDPSLLAKKDDVLQSCCKNIHELCHLLFETSDEVDELVRQLPSIVATLVPIAEGDSAGSEAAMEALEYLIITQHKPLKEGIRHLHPFPSNEKWSLINEAHSKVCGQISLLDEMKRCISVRSQLADYALSSKRALHHFAVQIRTRKSELFSLLYCADGKGEISRANETITQNWRLLVALQWELIQMCSHHQAESVRHSAARCLALLGPIDANIVAFSSDHDFSDSELSSKVSGKSDLSLHANVLNFLAKFVTDMDVRAAKVAALCLKVVLCQEESKRVVEELPPVVKAYLFPYYVSKPKLKRHEETLLNLCQFQLGTFGELHKVTVWTKSLWETQNKSYSQWVQLLAFKLLQEGCDPMLKSVSGMCLFKVEFASFVFPYAIRDVLSLSPQKKGKNSAPPLVRLLSDCIQDGENVECSLQLLDCMKFLRGEKLHQDLLKIEEYRRISQPTALGPKSKTRSKTQAAPKFTPLWEVSPWKYFDFLSLASAAQSCNAYLTSLFYLELWYESTYGQLSLEEKCHNQHPTDGYSDFLKLLQNVFRNTNDPDGIYGLGEAVDGSLDLIRIYEHEGDYSKAMVLYDMMLQSSSAGSMNTRRLSSSFPSNASSSSSVNPAAVLKLECQRGLLSALQYTGQYYLTSKFLDGIVNESADDMIELCEYQYEVAWRLGKWQNSPTFSQLFEHSRLDSAPTPFHEGAFRCLRSLHENDWASFHESADLVWKCLIGELGRSTAETTKNVYPMLAKLYFVERLRQVCLIKTDEESSEKGQSVTAKSFFEDWQASLRLMRDNNFELMDTGLELGSSVAELLHQQKQRPTHLLQVATLARKSGQLQRAIHALYRIDSLPQTEALPLSSLKVMMERSRIFWKQQDRRQAIREIKKLIDTLTGEELIENFENEHGILLSEALCFLGKWTAETRLGSANEIIENQFVKSIDCALKYGGNTTKMYFTMAKFADQFYQSLQERQDSSEWAASQALRAQHQEQLQKMKTASKNPSIPKNVRDACNRQAAALSRQLEIDIGEYRQVEKEMGTLLETALQNYISCLEDGNSYNIRAVFRLCSLWFVNHGREGINELIKGGLGRVPSYKFLPLAYQIVSRISGSESQPLFARVLRSLICKIAGDHPHHILWHLLALTKGGKTTYKTATSGNLKLIHDAKSLWDLIYKRKENIRDIMAGMTDLAAAYEELAELDFGKNGLREIKRSLTKKLAEIRQLSAVALPTIYLPVDPTGNYSSIVFPMKYCPTYQLVGGIHLPKLVTCIGSDGREYRQLVKSKDDLRQDAVMQQIFLLVNSLLQQNHETRVRNLCIRTYHVVPLTPCYGLLEWVEKTISMRSYLVGDKHNYLNCAHSRYRPNDYLSHQCRESLSNAKSERERIRVFKNITEHFKPVFHNFFLENFSDPATWFAKRLTYTRSAACNSMVGYIVGLGDRHVDNILLDQQSCELIHIDLGIAFEQGKTLRIPELVPFRLTRDVVDGMGITGVEGAYRGCCEETMKVLRANKEYVLTIVEVFVHDPLFRWSISPFLALQAQRNDEDDMEELEEVLTDDSNKQSSSDDHRNKDAERTLLRIKNKLQGCEHGEMLSVEGQVIQLINEARDPMRLALMYDGWSPWV